MIPNKTYFSVAFPCLPMPVSDVWRTLESFLSSQKKIPKWFYLNQIVGHENAPKSEMPLKLVTEQISEVIDERGLEGFQLDTGNSDHGVLYNLIHMKGSGNQSILSCRAGHKAKSPMDWSPVIEGCMTQWAALGAWQWCSLYDAWQNSEIPSVYRRHFGEVPKGMRSYSVKSSDLSPSVKERFDSSRNPGRAKQIVPGIYFRASAEMWLGPSFWQYATCTKKEVLASDLFLEQRDSDQFLYLKCWHHPFNRPDGEQGIVQKRIWEMFFDEDCEWPPGSDTIAATTSYGPSRLT